MQAKRIWETEAFHQRLERERDHKSALLSVKFFRKRRRIVPQMSAEHWTIFPGDQVKFKYFILERIHQNFKGRGNDWTR